MRWFKGLLAVAVVAMGLVGSAKADSITAVLVGGVSVPNGPNFDFTYDISLTTLMSLNATPVSDFFQIVDVKGYVSATWTPVVGTWTLPTTVAQNVVPVNPSGTITYLPDSVLIPNVLVTYTGLLYTNSTPSDVPIGTLVITSTLQDTMPGWMVGSDTQGSLNGSNFTACPVPIPTPAAAWAGLGLFALLAARKVMR